MRKQVHPKKKMMLLRYLGPGILVTVGFIDPGNWAANLAAGSNYGYALLWVVTVSTLMLILLQHNAAHLGICTGKCLAENTFSHLNPAISQVVLNTAFLASISTALAEILGAAIALNMLFHIPIKLASGFILGVVVLMIYLNSYKRIETSIIAFVAIISFCFLYELTLFPIDYFHIAKSTVTPVIPMGSLPLVLSILGAVVMPHNLFLHSEIIQSKKWFIKHPKLKEKLLKYEFFDTLFSMIIGWVVNSAIIILAAEVFFKHNIIVTELSQASELLTPLLGKMSAIIFAIALLFAGFSSSVTAGMSGGIIFSALFKKEYNEKDSITHVGMVLTLLLATVVVLFIKNPLQGLIYSQIFLSIQLPITIFTLVYLTAKKKVMGKYKNSVITNLLMCVCGTFIAILNIWLLVSLAF